MKKLIHRSSVEYRWVKYTQKMLEKRIKREVVITRSGEIYLRTGFGFEFLIDENNRNLVFDTFDDNNFKYLLSYLKDKMPPDSVILDVGAFSGGYSLALSSTFKNSKIYCFEPVQSSYRRLVKNIGRNGQEELIFPFRYAVSNKMGNVMMSNNLSTGNHIIEENLSVSDNTERIQSLTIDSFVTERKLQRLDFIKIDVEGHELFVIEGAINMIKRYKPIIYMEIQEEWTTRYGYTPVELITKVINQNYKVYIIRNSSITEVEDLDVSLEENENFLFMPS